MTYYNSNDIRDCIYRYRKRNPEKIKAIHKKAAAKYYQNNKAKFHAQYLYRAEWKQFCQMYEAFENVPIGL